MFQIKGSLSCYYSIQVQDKSRKLETDPSQAQASTDREKHYGNICTMRIIVDRFLLKLYREDKEQVKKLKKVMKIFTVFKPPGEDHDQDA